MEGIEVRGDPDARRGSRTLLHGALDAGAGPPGCCRSGRGEPTDLDLADVRGQEDAKRALEIAAAGGHNLLMIGPPGAGQDDARAAAAGHPAAARASRRRSRSRRSTARPARERALAAERPFRAPHHTISASGAGRRRRRGRMPGEITLAHRGVLFLDELARVPATALDALRQPLEEGRVEIMRGQRTLEFPANAMRRRGVQPLPLRAPPDRCRCTPDGAGALPAPPQRPAAGPHRPGLPGRAGADAGAGRRRGRAPRALERVRERVVARAERQRRGWPGPALSATATWTGG